MDFHDVTKLAEEHPVATGLGVVVLGLGVLYALGVFGSKASGGGSGGADAFYAAASAEAQSGNALQATQIAAQASTTQALALDDANVAIQGKWADTQLAVTNSNNSTQLQIAPYVVEGGLIQALATIAQTPPTVSTTTKNSQGIKTAFGSIGGGSKTTTTSTPSPAAQSAANWLQSLLPPDFHAPH